MRKAWVTLLSQPDYLPGVLALHRSLEATKSAYPLIVMVTANLGEEARHELVSEGCILREVERVSRRAECFQGYASPQFPETWTKLQAWSLTEFDRVVLLDADMLALRNMDELFDLLLPPGGIAACYACLCNPHRRVTYPSNWVPENCPYTHGERRGNTPQALPTDYLNSGLIVLTPGKLIFSNLLLRLQIIRQIKSFRSPIRI